jgi:GNAT superfamily N-acetyltransferase
MIYRDAASTAFDAKLASRAPWMTVRPEEVSDAPFLHTLFLAGNPLAGVLPPALIEQQAEIRLASFRDSYPRAMRRIFEIGGVPIGRIVIDSTTPGACLVIDIGVLPEYRRRGVASAALKAWTDVADALGLDCALTVLPNNPARALYARLGFVEETHREWDAGVHMFRLARRGRDAGRREGGPGCGARD